MKTREHFEKKILDIGKDWNADERETSILYDFTDKVVHLETSQTHTARRWLKLFWGDPEVKFDEFTDSFKLTVPIDYCRKPELVVMAKHRK